MKPLLSLLSVMLLSCAATPKPDGRRPAPPPTLELVAESRAQWTGVTVSRTGRVFVNYPRWSAKVPVSVAELDARGRARPYPSASLNAWAPGRDPSRHFVCVQSVVVDGANRLWILDPANPGFRGVVKGGAKLMQVDLSTNRVVRTIAFDETVAPAASYLNDVRVDPRTETAYISESGVGALVVVDLKSGQARRLLHKHRSTRSEGVVLTIGGRLWKRPDGSTPQVHADGIALHPTGKWLYWQALTGRTLYRIETRYLRDRKLSSAALATKVERVAAVGASDGILFDARGNLYLSSLEHDAVRRLTPAGRLEVVVKDKRLAWPDTFARSVDGWLYVTTAQIHRMPDPKEPYRLFRLRLPQGPRP